MECPICASAELRHSPGEQQLGGLGIRPDTVTCPNCGARAEQLSNGRLRFTYIPGPYSFPIGTATPLILAAKRALRALVAEALSGIWPGELCEDHWPLDSAGKCQIVLYPSKSRRKEKAHVGTN
jgi:hypothetical protein